MLEKFINQKREEVARRQKAVPLDQLISSTPVRQAPSFRAAILNARPGIIAEVKYASPSHGSFGITREPEAIALEYQSAGANAISVLTNAAFFDGSIENLQRVSQAVDLPTLCKDFVIDPYQIYEARAVGASAILLMVACLESDQLNEFIDLCRSLNITALVEVRNLQEAEQALSAGARTIGINNRDLQDLSVDLQRARDLAGHFAEIEQLCLICESGINSYNQIEELSALGYDGFLIGTALMESKAPAQFLNKLRGESQ